MVKSNIDKKFSAHYDAVEAELKSSTVGNWCLHTNPPVTAASISMQWCYSFMHVRAGDLIVSGPGLVTLNDMKAKQEALVKEREKQLAKKEQSKELLL